MSHKVLAEQSALLQKQYPADVKSEEDIAWQESPFDWMRKKASATKGKIGRDLFIGLLKKQGFTPSTRGVNVLVNGKVVVVRSSLAWGIGQFKFQQLRDNEYDFVFCLGLFPAQSYGWLIPKEELIDDGNMQDREGLTPQHGGHAGGEDFWLAVDASQVPTWLNAYGGHADALANILRSALA
jgi:hypothetical protein